MINKVMFLNIRHMKTQKSFERLAELHKRHKYSYITLFEPFQSPTEVEEYSRKLGMPNTKVNPSTKI